MVPFYLQRGDILIYLTIIKFTKYLDSIKLLFGISKVFSIYIITSLNPDRNFCLRVAPKPYQWHAYNEFIQKMSQRDPLKKIILSFFFCNSLVSRRYPWSVPFPFFGSLSTLRKIHEYPVIFLTRRNFPLPFKAGFTLRSLNG
jgi:hypothetical protein